MPCASAPHGIVQVSLAPCQMATPRHANVSHALAQLPQLTGLELGMFAAGDRFSATRAAGGWRVYCQSYLPPFVAAALARSFSGAAAPAGQQEQRQQQQQQPAGQQRSMFDAWVMFKPQDPSSEQALELASLGRALAAFDDVELGLGFKQGACLAGADALLAPVATRLIGVVISGAGSAHAVLHALQRLALPRLAELSLTGAGKCPLGAVTAVAGLDATRLASIILDGTIAGSRAAVAAAVTALAMGRPQPVGPDGRPAGLTIEVSDAALSDEELGSVREAVAAVRGLGCVTLKRPEP
jgi:hypothetical protein